MEALREELDALAAREQFAGVVRVDLPEDRGFAAAYGLADRRCGVANTVDTRFAIASGAKAFTALTVMREVEEGRLALATPARSVLGDDLPLIDERVTVQHLLEHSSGIGDYFDEDAADEITDYPLTVPVHTLATTEDYLISLDGFPQLFAPGERVKYCNGAYVVLALIAGRVSGTPFHELVETAVCGPAGMSDTAFLRSDELPAGTATGYLDPDGMRTNVLHLPVRGSGDGGIYSTAADITTLWTALMGAGIVKAATLATMTQPRWQWADEDVHYGLGISIDDASGALMFEGYDAGVSFFTSHDPARGSAYTVISNTSEGAWPVVTFLHEKQVLAR